MGCHHFLGMHLWQEVRAREVAEAAAAAARREAADAAAAAKRELQAAAAKLAQHSEALQQAGRELESARQEHHAAQDDAAK